MDNRYSRGILRELYCHGAMTRKQIMANLPMRLNSLIDVTIELEEAGMICREDATRQRNVPMMLNPKKFAAVGIEHGRDFGVLSLLSSSGERLATERVELNESLGGAERLHVLMDLIRSFVERHSDVEVSMLGFADIGIVNTESGTGVYSSNLSDWENVPLQAELERQFGYFTRIVDRTGAGALDYLRVHPEDESAQTSMMVYVGNGIGATVLRSGRYWGADTPSCCQLGHTIVVPGGSYCACGNRGCLETVAAIPAILADAGKRCGRRISSVSGLVDGVRRGESGCLEALEESGKALGIALANAVTFTAISNIYIRCELCRKVPAFFERIRQSLLENVIRPFRWKTRLTLSTQPENCVADGAAYYTQREYFVSE